MIYQIRHGGLWYVGAFEADLSDFGGTVEELDKLPVRKLPLGPITDEDRRALRIMQRGLEQRRRLGLSTGLES